MSGVPRYELQPGFGLLYGFAVSSLSLAVTDLSPWPLFPMYF